MTELSAVFFSHCGREGVKNNDLIADTTEDVFRERNKKYLLPSF